MKKIKVYIPNLPERTERLESIYETFKGKDEFELNIVPAIKKERGADGLWQTIYSIVEKVNDGDDEVIIICEDDHVFTSVYLFPQTDCGLIGVGLYNEH